MRTLLLVLMFSGLLYAGCTRLEFFHEKFTTSAGFVDGVSYSKFWRHGNGKHLEDIALIVYSDYDTTHESGLFGISIYGAGYQDRGGLVVTFSVEQPHGFWILDKYFDLRNGHFFHVYRRDPKHLAVQQESAISPLLQKIIAQ